MKNRYLPPATPVTFSKLAEEISLKRKMEEALPPLQEAAHTEREKKRPRSATGPRVLICYQYKPQAATEH